MATKSDDEITVDEFLEVVKDIETLKKQEARTMAKPDKDSNRQKQAEHFKEVLASSQEIIDDPESTPEEVNDAEQTARAMRDGLERLKTKYHVVPAGEEEAPPTV